LSSTSGFSVGSLTSMRTDSTSVESESTKGACTWGIVRRANGSCSRAGVQCASASSAEIRPATRCWEASGRRAWTRGSKGSNEPWRAAIDRAATFSAAIESVTIRWWTRAAVASVIALLDMNGSASASSTGATGAEPERQGRSPMRVSASCARGTRSPVPIEPDWCRSGTAPVATAAPSEDARPDETPERPEVIWCRRMAMPARAAASSYVAPIPVA
jgi:hypothetical protein